MKLINWKTTLAGILAIMPQVLHFIFPTVVTTAEAASISSVFLGLGLVAAKDGKPSLLQSPIVQEATGALPLVTDLITLESQAHPTNVLLSDVKIGLGKLNELLASLNIQPITAPETKGDLAAEEKSAPLPAPVIEAAPEPAPAAVAPAPLVSLYNRFSGKLLTEDPEPEQATA